MERSRREERRRTTVGLALRHNGSSCPLFTVRSVRCSLEPSSARMVTPISCTPCDKLFESQRNCPKYRVPGTLDHGISGCQGHPKRGDRVTRSRSMHCDRNLIDKSYGAPTVKRGSLYSRRRHSAGVPRGCAATSDCDSPTAIAAEPSTDRPSLRVEKLRLDPRRRRYFSPLCS
jgi:hypothetical protein